MKYLIGFFPEQPRVEDYKSVAELEKLEKPVEPLLDAFKKGREGEPVIPAFPTYPANHFLGMETFGFFGLARVVDWRIKIDEHAERLCKEYPGLPEDYILEYIVRTGEAAFKFPVHTVFRLLSDENKASLIDSVSGSVYTLWEQPIISKTV